MADPQGPLQQLIDCLTGTVRMPQEWGPLLRLASETLMIGSLAEAIIANCPDQEIPRAVMALLTEVRNRARLRNERLRVQLEEALPSLNALGVEPVLMKGMGRLLSSPAEKARLLSDIDLLVPTQRRDECIHALGRLGYGLAKPDRGHPESVELARTQDVGMIDLHTMVSRVHLRLEFQSISPHCRRIRVAAGDALLPSPTCQLMLNIAHDQLHDFDYWRGLIDVRHLMDVPRLCEEDIDWEVLAGFFPPGHPRNALHVQLRTARSLLGVQIPQEYCGGAWARLQVARRRVQLRWPALMQLLTLLTVAADPGPDDRRIWKRLARRWRYLRPVNVGKLSHKASLVR